jgi:hypothetical protein
MSIMTMIRRIRQPEPAPVTIPAIRPYGENDSEAVCADRGARLLDRVIGPGWRPYISAHSEEMRMESRQDCVLGLLSCAGYIPGWDGTGHSWRSPYTHALDFLGIREASRVYGFSTRGSWITLGDAWLREAAREPAAA